MTRDQELVQKLLARLQNWNPDGRCKYHVELTPCCEYDQQGRLIKLHLCKLGLLEVPSEVWLFSALQELYLSSNQLSMLPAEVGQIPTLQALDLSSNQLSILPAEISHLSALQHLELFDNHLGTLPAEMGQITSLRSLGLSHNYLSTLPAEMGHLTALQDLDLRDNQFHDLPAVVSQLTALQVLYVVGNPLNTPPPEIIDQGSQAILSYLRTLIHAGVERFEAKLILVGEGGMGKTSILRTLQQQPFVEGLSPTHGIEVSTLRVPHPTRQGQEIALYSWDFGGQDIYQATHQFFLTQRSVYLLVWDGRRGAEVCRVTFWLNTITSRAPDAKILLVATHRDQWPTPNINLASYRQRHPQIVGLCSLSNKTGDGFDELKVKLAEIAAETPFVGQLWPKTWVEAEEALLARPEHHLDRAAFIITCLQHKIEDETERETFGRYLHDLGKILYFHDDSVLRTLIILKPNWISKALSRVLEDPQVKQAGGILDYQELPRIWSSDEQGQLYPSTLYPIFVRMMERFQLCYQLEPKQPGQSVNQSLIPQLLPEQSPASLPPIPTVLEVGQMQVELRYRLSFVPAGLMSWFLVRTHRYSQGLHWREGARLAYAEQQAQVALDAQQREIIITVWGVFPYNFLLILKQTLDDIAQVFQGLQVQHMIPCRCPRQPETPHYHVYEDLERRLARGESEIICTEGERLPLTTLLYGLHVSTVSQVETTVQETLQTITKQLVPGQEAQQQLLAKSQQLLTQIYQMQELVLRNVLTLDQRTKKLEKLELEQESNPCPGLFVLQRATLSRINPHDWVSRPYHLYLLCQYPPRPHLAAGESGYEIRQGKDWWIKMSPWLRRMVKLLEIGLPLGKAINEGFKFVDVEQFSSAVDVFNEILADLPEIEASEALNKEPLAALALPLQRLEGAPLEALYSLLKGYPRPWQGLVRVIADDGSILWLCDHHRKEFEAGLISVP